ncbi:MAG TPA: hypothetical protein VK631_10055 [Solirubrobacteraceae bacterium]|nr:hypothetical protein [Solirubrobacteraceae bacterium]
MAGAWPPMPDWLRVELARSSVRRGERVRVRWEADGTPDGYELRLVLVVHHGGSDSMSPPGQAVPERQVHVVHDRAALAPGRDALSLRVPPDAPYSYAGRVLAFFWGVALARADADREELDGWTALRVLP